MKREMRDKNILDDFVEQFCAVVERYVEYMICSGFSAIASGRTRGTEDIDMVISKISFDKFAELHRALIAEGFECIQSEQAEVIYNDYLSDKTSVRYTWRDKPLPEMEIHFAFDELDEEQIKGRIKMPLTGLNVYFAPIEGNIAFKELWLGANKDLEDALHLRRVYQGMFSEDKVEYFKNKIKERKLKDE